MAAKLPIFALFLTFTVWACTEEQKSYTVFKDNASHLISYAKKKLNGENIGPSEGFGLVTNIKYHKGTLVLLDEKNDHAFHIVNLKDNTPYKILKIGEGPEEIKTAQFLKITDIEPENNLLHFYNFPEKSISQINLSKGAIREIVFPLTDSKIPDVQSALLISDSTVVTVGLTDSFKLFFYNRKNEQVKTVPFQWSVNPKPENPNGIINLSPTDISKNKKHQLLIPYTGQLNSIDCYSTEGAYIKTFSYGENENYSERGFESTHFYFYNINTEEDWIYGLYDGFGPIAQMTEKMAPHLKSEFHLINLVTDEVTVYKLDRLVNACDLDVENKILYCIDENNEDQPIVKYELE